MSLVFDTDADRVFMIPLFPTGRQSEWPQTGLEPLSLLPQTNEPQAPCHAPSIPISAAPLLWSVTGATVFITARLLDVVTVATTAASAITWGSNQNKSSHALALLLCVAVAVDKGNIRLVMMSDDI